MTQVRDGSGPMETDFSYVGEELDLFAHAARWKRYWASKIAPYIGVNVLEVGAGTGSNTLLLASSRQSRWVCLEPDAALVTRLKDRIQGLQTGPSSLESLVGGLSSVPDGASFDTILYIDVLEHIEADRNETARAYELLTPGGYLIVLSPAHQFLYSPFDKNIGHFRRYSRRSLRAAGPPGQKPLRIFYLDACGFAASLANRLLLRQELPALSQIQFWDKYLIQASKIVDPLLGYRFGKTVVGVWKRR